MYALGIVFRHSRATVPPFLDDQSLNTSLGALYLGPVRRSAEESDDMNPQTREIFIKNSWITWNGRNHFWLPPEYRPKYTAVYGNIVAIIIGNHEMTVFKFTLH
ncbi:unnamed protein product [Aspergillus oryzae RIB40]|uniref:DNA, SC026 n=2 Tax=Aspergillus oryzae TaxID=5062 RepID=Q2UE37_ASPOR|nr:unnamed protein product [Aspergillus oryzae RIB40]EIT82052.1 hypothetical protein Ao3042_00700 [Aspergillus oryzae 3.042]KDE79744.1 hypothetical protein AO1008_05779 [Aspergillus oryzae 100-8]BAE60178.1 unnamed protein product [Aspergillus oryzae RIB40]|eukprot:EIT82052.1 hypothetical protein Ao3042_00700 [Aspergillus oryzae 3.042]